MRNWTSDPAVIRSGFRETFHSLGDPDFGENGSGEDAERAWWRKVVERTAVSAGIDPADDLFEPCFADLFDHYAAGAAWKVFPEVEGVLREVRAAGAKMAVVSNFDRRLHRVLDELGLTGCFDLVLTSADVAARKPSPKLLHEAVRRLDGHPEKTCLVGDSEGADGGSARSAGISCFILDRPRTTLRSYLEWLSENFS